MQQAESDTVLGAHAHRHWANVVPLGVYRPGRLRRPEAIEIAASSS